MTRRSEAIRIRTVLVGLALALLVAMTLFIPPSGVAFADTKLEKCSKDGAVSEAANNPGLVSDCVALLKARKKLEGKGGRKLDWSSDVPMSRWEGVTLDGWPLRVTKIQLDGRGSSGKLKGEIPKQLGNLSELEWLLLYYNELGGQIPPQLAKLSNLEHLSLLSNDLTGSIPPQLGRLSKLEGLDLGGNNLTGKIPNKLGKLSNLRALYLYHNNLSGKIPEQLSKLSNLEILMLRQNQLTGPIPEWLGELPNLSASRLEIQLNTFSGCVPESLSGSPYICSMYDRDERKGYQLPVCD